MDRAIRVGIHYLRQHSTALPVLADAFRPETAEYFREWSTNDLIERLLKPWLHGMRCR